MALTRYHHLPMHFPAAIYCMQNFNIFCPWGPTMVCIWAKLKLVEFYRYFSQYNFKNSIRTLDKLQKRVGRTIGLPFHASLEPLTHCQLEDFTIGITFLEVHQNWPNWFRFLVFMTDLFVNQIGCMIFLSPFLVIRMSMSRTSFINQLDPGTPFLQNSPLWFMIWMVLILNLINILFFCCFERGSHMHFICFFFFMSLHVRSWLFSLALGESQLKDEIQSPSLDNFVWKGLTSKEAGHTEKSSGTI